MSLKKKISVQAIVGSLLVSLMTILLLGILLQIEPVAQTLGSELLKVNDEATKSANAVTSVVTYFRGLDTLGEVTILFLSVFGISLGMEKFNEKQNILSYENSLLEIGVKVLFPLIVLFGIYIIIHGHLSPGGGFQGGVIIASGFLLLFLAHGNEFSLNHRVITLFESLSGAGLVLFGFLGVWTTGLFFGNFLPLGSLGKLFSAGVIPLIYIFVGLKVSAEISALAEYFIKAKDAKVQDMEVKNDG
ncbi:MAG: MnhB domain-containing protein [Campylobacterota bacterium]|nr:MnhB domain-containing protein [Campylobacterota bacterium]